MTKLKYILALVVMTGVMVFGLPYIIKHSIDTIIENEQQKLNSKGMELIVVSHKGYFQSTREINIEFTDTVKVLDYISEITNLDIETIRNMTNNGFIFSDISFKGVVTNSNLFSQTIKTKISLDKLPLELQENMAKNKQLDSFIKSLLLNIEFDMEGNIGFMSLNDIVIKENDFEVKMIKPELKIEKNIYNTSIQNITLNVNENDEYMLVYLDDITDTLRYVDEFNFEEKAKISKIKFNYQDRYTGADVQYESINNTIQTNAITKDEKLNASLKYDMDNLFVSTQGTDINIEKFVFNIDLNEIKEQPLRALNNSLTNEYQFGKILVPNVQEIVNDGFTIDIDTNISNLQNTNIAAKEIGLNLKFVLAKNDLNQYSRADKILENLTVDGQISLDEETLEKISLMMPVAQYNTNIKEGISYFDIELKDSSLFVNGIKLR